MGAAGGGQDCPAANGQTEEQDCNQDACISPPPPTNRAGEWSGWGLCSATCGGGTQYRTYSITTEAAGGGQDCPATNGQTEEQACNEADCGPAVACAGEWSTWGECSVPCGVGVQFRTYSITTRAANGGQYCPARNGQSQQRQCNRHSCIEQTFSYGVQSANEGTIQEKENDDGTWGAVAMAVVIMCIFCYYAKMHHTQQQSEATPETTFGVPGPNDIVYYSNSHTWAYYHQIRKLVQEQTISADTMIFVDDPSFGKEWRKLREFLDSWQLTPKVYRPPPRKSPSTAPNGPSPIEEG